MCLANKTTSIFLVTTLMKIIQKIAVPNYPIYDFGAKLSVFTMLVPNCPFAFLASNCYSTLMVFLFNRIVPVEPSWFRIFMSPLGCDCLPSRWSTLGTKYRGTETKIRKCECKNKWQTSREGRLAKPAMLVSEPHLCVDKYNLKYTYLFTCVWTRISLRHLSEVWTMMAHRPTHVVVAKRQIEATNYE